MRATISSRRDTFITIHSSGSHRSVTVVKLRERSIHEAPDIPVRPSVHLSLINAPVAALSAPAGDTDSERADYLPVARIIE